MTNSTPEQEQEAMRREFAKCLGKWAFLMPEGTIGRLHQEHCFETGYQAATAQLDALRKEADAFKTALLFIATHPDYTNPEYMVRTARKALGKELQA